MLHIGLTGGIGSGKSSVAAMFSDLGAVPLDADRIVRELLSADGVGVGPVAKVFGETILEGNGSVNRSALAAIVFDNEKARRKLEAILHPMVLNERRRMVREIEREKGADVVVITEASLIFEAHTEAEFDAVILVTAPEEVRKARLLEAGWSPEDVERRMRAQWPDSAKVRLADYIIENGGSPSRTRSDVKALWSELEERARASR